MFDNEDDELGVGVELEEDLTPEDVLLYSTFAGPRLFVLNNANMTNVLGVLMDESDDSFLVGLPIRLMNDGNDPTKIKAEPFAPVPYIRVLKSAIITVSYLYGIFESEYTKYILEKGAALYPEITDYLEEGEESEEVSVPNVPTQSVDVSLTNDTETPEEVQGMSNEELKKYLTDKYNNGELTGVTRKKQ